jgi:hypothetical protein
MPVQLRSAWVIATSRLQDAVTQSDRLNNVILHYKETSSNKLKSSVQGSFFISVIHTAKPEIATPEWA